MLCRIKKFVMHFQVKSLSGKSFSWSESMGPANLNSDVQKKMWLFLQKNLDFQTIGSGLILLLLLACHPQLERQIGQFLCEKVMLYIIFTSSSSWFQPCTCWNDRKAEIRGQPVLGHSGPSPPACFGSNEGYESSRVTAETGRKAWPRVP